MYSYTVTAEGTVHITDTTKSNHKEASTHKYNKTVASFYKGA